MKEFDDVVLLIYDNSDGRGKVRLRLFKSWFDDLYYKKDYEDFSFMTNKNYQKKEEVENIFDCHSLDFWDYQL
ncbi:hypothetical protein EZS27_020974 [termite gut metagenome]|uniref:Uncharacterized protein n=1 Tax=termite gut metagenome TaxID=433724 RepID=A0A5J4R9S4_9ZZZZ